MRICLVFLQQTGKKQENTNYSQQSWSLDSNIICMVWNTCQWHFLMCDYKEYTYQARYGQVLKAYQLKLDRCHPVWMPITSRTCCSLYLPWLHRPVISWNQLTILWIFQMNTVTTTTEDHRFRKGGEKENNHLCNSTFNSSATCISKCQNRTSAPKKIKKTDYLIHSFPLTKLGDSIKARYDQAIRWASKTDSREGELQTSNVPYR